MLLCFCILTPPPMLQYADYFRQIKEKMPRTYGGYKLNKDGTVSIDVDHAYSTDPSNSWKNAAKAATRPCANPSCTLRIKVKSHLSYCSQKCAGIVNGVKRRQHDGRSCQHCGATLAPFQDERWGQFVKRKNCKDCKHKKHKKLD